MNKQEAATFLYNELKEELKQLLERDIELVLGSYKHDVETGKSYNQPSLNQRASRITGLMQDLYTNFIYEEKGHKENTGTA